MEIQAAPRQAYTMATFQQPFQCIQLVQKKNSNSKNVLVASAGAKLYSYVADSGQSLSVWPQDGADTSNANNAGSNPDIEGPPEKKRKVEPSSEQDVKNSAPAAKKAPAWTNIPILTATPDGEYLVALTGEDKCIRVFQIEEDGSFLQLSERHMPKRPCAITFMENNDILTGDKFGDVYSMPLIPSAEPRIPKSASQPRSTRIAATNLTVHTQRNLKSLQMQEEQKKKALEAEKNKNKDNDKEDQKPIFEHDLLLGHVSLLTDVAFTSLPSPDPSSSKRTYILSADRDEHIRVSRGPPQAHIIENHCFGHTAFISKLCVPEWAPTLLVSGGGDPHLLVWNWLDGQLLHTVPLLEQTSEAAAEGEAKEIAVRGIWASPSSSSDSDSDTQRLILVALEGNPTLYPFTLNADGTMTRQTPLLANGNILDIQITPSNTILISIDTIHSPGSTSEWRSGPASPAKFIEAFSFKPTEKGEWEAVEDGLVSAVDRLGTESVVVDGGAEKKVKNALSNGLYGLENLRKKTWDDPEAANVM
ncbi:putative tRNA methyltransferase [Aspergillus undulatus]|uniref:putative tRNA methyltransferase n=1 Tax=Aspergillus undulatus TaxID=1810928 RepID=UPI003CCD3ADE